MSAVYIRKIRESESGSGYDVFLSTGVTYQNVSRDVVRCVAGSDLDHMLKTAGDDYIKVSANDLKDFSMHKEN